MKKENPLAGKTITLEFYINENKKLHVKYNTIDYAFTDFWKKADNAEFICGILFKEFKKKFPEKFVSSDIGSKDWEETLIKFINNHLRDYDGFLDILIRSSGNVVVRLER